MQAKPISNPRRLRRPRCVVCGFIAILIASSTLTASSTATAALPSTDSSFPAAPLAKEIVEVLRHQKPEDVEQVFSGLSENQRVQLIAEMRTVLKEKTHEIDVLRTEINNRKFIEKDFARSVRNLTAVLAVVAVTFSYLSAINEPILYEAVDREIAKVFPSMFEESRLRQLPRNGYSFSRGGKYIFLQEPWRKFRKYYTELATDFINRPLRPFANPAHMFLGAFIVAEGIFANIPEQGTQQENDKMLKDFVETKEMLGRLKVTADALATTINAAELHQKLVGE
ncbi:MAG: hypothetical protein C5B49_09365 [Bdellovibrio sp.]|nr:MAG: hypothetical protein C5B49_09365 [Bdellovibrio sp.]